MHSTSNQTNLKLLYKQIKQSDVELKQCEPHHWMKTHWSDWAGNIDFRVTLLNESQARTRVTGLRLLTAVVERRRGGNELPTANGADQLLSGTVTLHVPVELVLLCKSFAAHRARQCFAIAVFDAMTLKRVGMRKALVTAAAGVWFHYVFRMGDGGVLREQPDCPKLRAAASTPVRLLGASLRVEQSCGRLLLLEDLWWLVVWNARPD